MCSLGWTASWQHGVRRGSRSLPSASQGLPRYACLGQHTHLCIRMHAAYIPWFGKVCMPRGPHGCCPGTWSVLCTTACKAGQVVRAGMRRAAHGCSRGACRAQLAPQDRRAGRAPSWHLLGTFSVPSHYLIISFFSPSCCLIVTSSGGGGGGCREGHGAPGVCLQGWRPTARSGAAAHAQPQSTQWDLGRRDSCM